MFVNRSWVIIFQSSKSGFTGKHGPTVYPPSSTQIFPIFMIYTSNPSGIVYFRNPHHIYPLEHLIIDATHSQVGDSLSKLKKWLYGETWTHSKSTILDPSRLEISN